MSTILNFLSNDHRACDDLFASAESAAAQQNWHSARALFDQFQTAMSHHLSMEETVLFPAFEARIGNSMGGLSETLNMLMQQHNMKEENMLYPMSDQVLSSDRDSVILAMQAIA